MLEDNQNEIAARMAAILKAARNNNQSSSHNNVRSLESGIDISHDEAWLPKVEDGEFIVKMIFEGTAYVCCMIEPTWREAASIELYAFRKTSDGREYFSGEYERRELLKKSLKWIADMDKQEIHHVICPHSQH